MTELNRLELEKEAKKWGVKWRSDISDEALAKKIEEAVGDTMSQDPEPPRFRSIRIKEFVKDIGEGQTETVYACGGLHLSAEHRKMLPPIQISNLQGKTVEKHVRKIEPGKDYELPEDVALYYLKENRRFLEEVYE